MCYVYVQLERRLLAISELRFKMSDNLQYRRARFCFNFHVAPRHCIFLCVCGARAHARVHMCVCLCVVGTGAEKKASFFINQLLINNISSEIALPISNWDCFGVQLFMFYFNDLMAII
jgi:hypothetical protein